MPGVITNFASMSGNVPASELDEAFAEAATLTAVDELTSTVAQLPSADTPLVPVAGGDAGAASDLSRSDHQHPPQSATINLQTGTAYTLQATDNGKVVEFSNASAITVTVPSSLPVAFNCLLAQVGAGQVTFVAGSGATQRQSLGLTKTARQWSIVSMYVRANGGSSAEYVLSGDMSA